MAGFVRGGPQGKEEVRRRRPGTEPGSYIDVVEDSARAIIVTPQREIIQIENSDPLVVHVVEPVLIGELPTSSGALLTESDLGVRIAELDDQGHVPAAQLRQCWHHMQLMADEVWRIEHNLGYRPAGIIARENDGVIIHPADITWPDPENIVYLHFPGRLVSGYADVS
jgi:hypothetical protein